MTDKEIADKFARISATQQTNTDKALEQDNNMWIKIEDKLPKKI